MSRTFTLCPDLAGADPDNGSVDAPLICWRGATCANPVSSNHPAQPGDTRRTRSPTPRQRSRQTTTSAIRFVTCSIVLSFCFDFSPLCCVAADDDDARGDERRHGQCCKEVERQPRGQTETSRPSRVLTRRPMTSRFRYMRVPSTMIVTMAAIQPHGRPIAQAAVPEPRSEPAPSWTASEALASLHDLVGIAHLVFGDVTVGLLLRRKPLRRKRL